jgi:two-component system sensor histidine kinase CpxA
MRSLFIKIFVSFFLTVVLLGLLLEVTAIRADTRRVQAVIRPIAERAAREAADTYESTGDDALVSMLEHLPVLAGLLDDRGKPVGRMSAAMRPGADAAGALLAGSQELLTQFASTRDIGLQPVTSSSGRHYVLVFVMPHERWSAILNTLDEYPALRLSIVGLVAGVICFVLARHITTPIVRLRSTVDRMAEGRLDARAGPSIARRHDEIGALGRDFDHMADRLSTLVAAERQLLADVSHELRSPLARLTVAVGLLRQRVEGQAPFDEAQGRPLDGAWSTSEELSRIEREVDRLDALIGQSLTLARIDSGVGTGARESFDLASLVQEVAADGDYEARARDRRVEVPAADPCFVTGVPELVRSAIENVVRNAIRYTAPGTSVDVTVARELRGAAPMARVRVRDHGPGIPDAMLSEVFLPFRRVEGSRGRADGAGLGLAIADRVVRLHGGTIHAANANGGGLIVEMTFGAIVQSS